MSKGIFLKVQSRREKKLKEMQESPLKQQTQLLKVMERRLNKMMRE